MKDIDRMLADLPFEPDQYMQDKLGRKMVNAIKARLAEAGWAIVPVNLPPELARTLHALAYYGEDSTIVDEGEFRRLINAALASYLPGGGSDSL